MEDVEHHKSDEEWEERGSTSRDENVVTDYIFFGIPRPNKIDEEFFGAIRCQIPRPNKIDEEWEESGRSDEEWEERDEEWEERGRLEEECEEEEWEERGSTSSDENVASDYIFFGDIQCLLPRLNKIDEEDEELNKIDEEDEEFFGAIRCLIPQPNKIDEEWEERGSSEEEWEEEEWEERGSSSSDENVASDYIFFGAIRCLIPRPNEIESWPLTLPLTLPKTELKQQKFIKKLSKTDNDKPKR
ncbi:uncharacterized protein LOC125210695 [Salvia hispanica]|uniref:uncharacterized protein LOC125210695 n=1 Tax=Salvia hispanica TaxID=49212 RepID=UPI002009A9B3|nr:uncharacterized protein LOC125210695 [Salvia hispanica]